MVWRFEHPVFFTYLEDLGVVGRIILKWIFRKWDVGDMNWIDLVQDSAVCVHL
jgi:hypothetical protein